MRLLSQDVGPSGTVIAGDISPAFIQLLNDQLAKDSRLKNVQVVQGTNKNINFPSDKKCDLIVVCDVYHHFEYPRTTCRQIREALKSNGKLVVIDFHKDESKIKTMPKGWVTDHLRGTQDDFRKEIESAGFRLIASPEIEGLTDNYCMVFEPTRSSN
jgi:ubiquinone/menaquinone biosynthesis C-methylase UbiE